MPEYHGENNAARMQIHLEWNSIAMAITGSPLRESLEEFRISAKHEFFPKFREWHFSVQISAKSFTAENIRQNWPKCRRQLTVRSLPGDAGSSIAPS